MQNTSSGSRSTGLSYNLHTTQRTETSDEVSVAMGSGAAANGIPADRNYPSDGAPPKKSAPANGKKTKGRVKIKMEFIDNKLRRYTTFSKRKTGIMKKAYELSTLTGTQVMLLVASETGHVYTFATRKLQPMITSEAGKALIQTCLNSPDPPPGPGSSGHDQRMSATGFEETELTYTVGDDCERVIDMRNCNTSSSPGSPNSIDENSPSPHMLESPSPQMVHLAVNNKSSDSSADQRQQIQNNNTGFATIITTPGGALTSAVQIGAIHPNSESSLSGTGQVENSSIYRIPSQGTSQPFTLAITGSSKNQTNPSHNSASSPISVVPNTQQNVSLLSGNVVIPAGQTLLQPSPSPVGNNGVQGAFMYHTTQGLMYATPASIPEGVILNLGQDQSVQQFLSIPVSLSLTPAQQQQLMQVTTATTPCQITSCSPPKREKTKK